MFVPIWECSEKRPVTDCVVWNLMFPLVCPCPVEGQASVIFYEYVKQ